MRNGACGSFAQACHGAAGLIMSWVSLGSPEQKAQRAIAEQIAARRERKRTALDRQGLTEKKPTLGVGRPTLRSRSPSPTSAS